MTTRVEWRITRRGRSASADAIAVISMPTKEKAASRMPGKIEPEPSGTSPPCSMTFFIPGEATPGSTPNTASSASVGIAISITTLISTSQN